MLFVKIIFMDRLIRLFQKNKVGNDRSLDAPEIATNLERRKKFLRYLNRGWLIFGIVTLLTLPLFSELRHESIFLAALIFPTYLIVRFLNVSGKVQLAGAVFTLAVTLNARLG
jgi:hypothetical protein